MAATRSASLLPVTHPRCNFQAPWQLYLHQSLDEQIFSSRASFLSASSDLLRLFVVVAGGSSRQHQESHRHSVETLHGKTLPDATRQWPPRYGAAIVQRKQVHRLKCAIETSSMSSTVVDSDDSRFANNSSNIVQPATRDLFRHVKAERYAASLSQMRSPGRQRRRQEI
jgi:hypothetical protein